MSYLVVPELFCFVLNLQCVHGSLEDPKTLTHHKLIHAATERVLSDTKTVADENLKDKGMQRLSSLPWFATVFHDANMFNVCCRCFAAHKEKTATNPSKDG